MRIGIGALLLLLVCSSVSQRALCNLKAGKELSEPRRKQFAMLLGSGVDSAAIRFDIALDYAKLGNYQKALTTLQEALHDDPWLDPGREADFKPLSGCAAFKELVGRIETKHPSVANSSIAYTVPQTDLIPEGLAADPDRAILYLSSIYHRKIVKITSDGESSNFVHEGQNGLLGVLGLKVDPRDHSVWAASERTGRSLLFHFDSTGRMIAKYSPRENGKHLFNDLVITADGDVFVTDSDDNSIYKLPRKSDTLVRYGLGRRFILTALPCHQTSILFM